MRGAAREKRAVGDPTKFARFLEDCEGGAAIVSWGSRVGMACGEPRQSPAAPDSGAPLDQQSENDR